MFKCNLLGINSNNLLNKLKINVEYIRLLSNNANQHYDIIIAGGGMVGTSLACSLGKNKKLSEKRILLLEGSKKKQWTLPPEYSNRVVSLNQGTKTLLQDIGAWNFIEKSRVSTVKRLQVWDALSESSITFGHSDHTETISYIVENDLLLAAVTEQTKSCNNVDVKFEAKVKNYTLPEHHESMVKIQLENGQEFNCDLLLGCDGANSAVRKAMQADSVSWNYNQMGIVATMKFCEKIKNEIAWQRFLPTGPIAFLPLTDELSSLVWSTSVEDAKRLLSLPEERFIEEINMAMFGTFNCPPVVLQASALLDTLIRAMNCPVDDVRQYPPKIDCIKTGSRAAFPLGFGHSSQYIRKGVVLVGDAAHRIHPLAGQGVNLGFGDVVCLTKVLADAVYNGSTITDLNCLKVYESERQQHNVPTMLAVDGLHRLYNTDFTPFVLLRSLGLQFTHALDPLKRVIISQAAV